MKLVIVAVCVALVAGILMYIDGKIFDEPKKKSTYFKNMVLTGGLAALVVHLGLGGRSGAASGGAVPAFNTNSTSMLSDINEKVLTGMPPF